MEGSAVVIYKGFLLIEVPGRTLSAACLCKSLPARIPFFQLFLSFPIARFRFIRYPSLSVQIIIFSLVANGYQDTLFVFKSHASLKVLFVHPDIQSTFSIHPSKTVSTTTFPYILWYIVDVNVLTWCTVYRIYVYIILQVCRTRVTVCTHRKQGFMTNNDIVVFAAMAHDPWHPMYNTII